MPKQVQTVTQKTLSMTLPFPAVLIMCPALSQVQYWQQYYRKCVCNKAGEDAQNKMYSPLCCKYKHCTWCIFAQTAHVANKPLLSFSFISKPLTLSLVQTSAVKMDNDSQIQHAYYKQTLPFTSPFSTSLHHKVKRPFNILLSESLRPLTSITNSVSHRSAS